MTAEIFDSNTRIETVFVDGKPYKPAVETPPGGRGQTTEEPGEIR